MTNADVLVMLPEIILALTAIALLMVGAFAGERATPAIAMLAVVAIAVAAVVTGLVPLGSAFDGVFVLDAFARVLKVVMLVGAAVAVAMSIGYARHTEFGRSEYPVILLLSTVGMMLMISAGDMLSVYLGLELQSLAVYIAVSVNRDSTRSTEAGLKYFVLGALSSGMLLYGISLVYGFTAATGFHAIAGALGGPNGVGLGAIFGIVFVIAGLAFKVSAVPFHMWTPDVYEGAPTPVTAFIAAAPKVAAIALFVRVMTEAFGPASAAWQQILIVISVMSMLLGAFAAIGQVNIKRLLAYSSIGHMGYALMGLAAGTQTGVASVVIYISVYVLTTLGSFACVLAMRRPDGRMVEDITDLSGAARTNPFLAFAFMALLFSLAGIPPLVGFFAKLAVFDAAIDTGLWPLALIGAIATAVGAFYYLRIVKVMVFDAPEEEFAPVSGELRVVYGAAAAFSLLFYFVWTPILTAAQTAAQSLF